MPKARFLEPVFYQGTNYQAGEEYSLSAEAVAALGNSVTVVGKDNTSENAEETSQDATVAVEKAVDAPNVDKMVKAPATKK